VYSLTLFKWVLFNNIACALTFIPATGTTFAQQATADPTLVQLDSGKVRGIEADGVIAFKDIPFAQPPVGSLRWRPPQTVKPWQGVREAKAFSPNPMQPPGETSTNISEDCLYLNVWRPAATAGKPLPVVVWIYGGGLVRGGASLYPGEFLARQAIVVVSFSYRLSRFGFFAHPALAQEDPEAPRGNYGYMDQVAALQWVKRNIAAFGGDPNNVTIAGESAGGGSVLVLLTSPLARGLFQRAILESAGLPSPRTGAMRLNDLAVSQTMAVDYAHTLGVKGDGKAALTKLRALPAATLNRGTENYISAVFGGPQLPGLANSVLDGRLIVEAPEAALRNGRWAMVPVIVGANDADLAGSPAPTKDELFALFGPLAPQARAQYDPKGDASLKDLIQPVIADRVMVEPSRHMAELMTKAGQPAYWYRFSYVAEAQRGKIPGATHAYEIPYAFDAVAAVFKDQASATDVSMGNTMSGYWVAFVKTGNPNGGGRPECRATTRRRAMC
jgi:para-nitrobenzyl esterase